MRSFKLRPAISVSENNPSHNHGRRFSETGAATTEDRAVVVMVIVTFPEIALSAVGLKLQDAAVGNPLQLNVTVPAAAVTAIPKTYCAGCPAFTVTVAPPDAMAKTGPISVVMLSVLFLGSVSPVAETVATIEPTDNGAFKATLKVIVTAGKT
jgi:hypothetical protein